VISSLPDIIDLPSGEKTTDLTSLVCPEIIAVWLPVIASIMMTFPFPDPAATVLFQYEMTSILLSSEII